MKKRMKICSVMIIAAQLCSMSCYAAYTKFTQSAENSIHIESDGYSAYQVVPVMFLKADEPSEAASEETIINNTLSNLENATNANISNVVKYVGSLSADADGNISGEVDLSNTNFESKKDYIVLLNGAPFRLKYMDNNDRLEIIDNIISAANAGKLDGSDGLNALFIANKDYFSFDDNILSVCGDLIDTKIESITKVLMAEINKQNITTGTSSTDKLNKVPEFMRQAMLVAALNEGKVNSKEIIDNTLVGGKYQAKTLALSNKISQAGLDDFIAKISSKSYSSISEAETKITKQLILDAICYQASEELAEMQAILTGHNDALELDLTDFNKLSSENKASAVRSFANAKPTIDTMQSVLNGFVSPLLSSGQTITESPTISGSSSSGSSSGSVGGGSSEGAYLGIQNAIFSDISNYSWAQQAITSLYSMGIISGYGNGSFAPQNNIKREEFVTIVVSAFYKDAEMGTDSFADVSEDAWYYKNVAIAANQGIISGMGENSFGVGQNITRQDMAVILYRIAGDKLEKPENYNTFSDDGDIADYAKEAVYALKAAGVINGVSTSEFAPKKNATRAETAVMVYKFLSIIGKEGV